MRVEIMKMNIASEDDIAYYIRQFLEDVALALQLFFNAASRILELYGIGAVIGILTIGEEWLVAWFPVDTTTLWNAIASTRYHSLHRAII